MVVPEPAPDRGSGQAPRVSGIHDHGSRNSAQSVAMGPRFRGDDTVTESYSDACRIRQDRCGENMMDATLILIDSDVELARARSLVDRLWDSNDPADVARLEAQARLIAAYEERKWPRRPPRTALSFELIRSVTSHALPFSRCL